MEWGAKPDRTVRTALFGLFFVSGAAALVYQTAWHRLLGLFAGADTISAALVVGAFLLGLGLGSLAAGLVADRLTRRMALAAFAASEVGIAAFAAISPWLFYDVIYRGLLPLAGSRAIVFAVVFAALLWPTFLMGCSLPLLSKAVVTHSSGSARPIGWLYGVNTLGAAAGAFVGGWLLIGTVGFDRAVHVGAALNLAVAVGGLMLVRRVAPGDSRQAAAPAPAPAARQRDHGLLARWCLLVFVSGFLIVALQIVWYRLIGVLMQSNAYSFSLVLSAFLLGDAAGLLAGAHLVDRVGDPRRFFFQMQGVATALALGGAWFFWWGMGAGLLHNSFVDRDIMLGTAGDIGTLVLMLVLIVLPASFIMGFSFPVVQRAVQHDIGQLGRRLGLVQLANIAGNSAGSLAAGLLLLDLVGTAGTLKLLVLIGLCFALLHLASAHLGSARLDGAQAGGRASFSRWAYLPAVLLAAGAVLFPADEAFWRRLHRLTTERAVVVEDKTGLSLLKMTSETDGQLYIQGHTQSDLPFNTMHVFFGALGPLAHPAPRDVLVIGSGTGGTPYSAGLRPQTQRVRVVEIVAPVIATLRRYVQTGGRAGVDALLADPKFEILIADGRHTLALDQTHYDVIEADAIMPKTALSGLLYSQEFFQQVRSRLNPGGIYVQWAPTERTVDTFRSVFPYVTRLEPALLGSDQPIAFDRANVLRLLQEPKIEAHLAAARVDRGQLAQWLASKPIEPLNQGQAVPADAPNTDLFPPDEYYLNRP